MLKIWTLSLCGYSYISVRRWIWSSFLTCPGVIAPRTPPPKMYTRQNSGWKTKRTTDKSIGEERYRTMLANMLAGIDEHNSVYYWYCDNCDKNKSCSLGKRSAYALAYAPCIPSGEAFSTVIPPPLKNNLYSIKQRGVCANWRFICIFA